MPKAIVILSFNHPEITKRCVDSARRHHADEHILLVHNGSQKKFVDELITFYPLIRHSILTENKGFSGGANHGLREAFKNYDWALFITNDCELLRFPETSLPPGLYAPHILKRKTELTDSLGGQVQLTKAMLSHNKLQNEIVSYVPGTAFLIHKDIFSSGHSFNEKLGTYWEDVDLSIRVSRSGFPIANLQSIQLRHGIGKTCHKDTHYTTYLYQRNRAIVCRQHLKRKNRAAFEAHYLFDISFRIGKLLLRRKWPQALLTGRAYWDSWKNYSTTLSAAEIA